MIHWWIVQIALCCTRRSYTRTGAADPVRLLLHICLLSGGVQLAWNEAISFCPLCCSVHHYPNRSYLISVACACKGGGGRRGNNTSCPFDQFNKGDNTPCPFDQFYKVDNTPCPFDQFNKVDNTPCPFDQFNKGNNIPCPFEQFNKGDNTPCPFDQFNKGDNTPCPFYQFNEGQYSLSI